VAGRRLPRELAPQRIRAGRRRVFICVYLWRGTSGGTAASGAGVDSSPEISMPRSPLARLFAMPLVAALIAPLALLAQAGVAVQPPAAKTATHEVTIHGRTLKDNYFWLRDKSNPDVIKHLEAENAYTEAVMAPTRALQETLYKEMSDGSNRPT
jgi:hypothetical protein